MDLLISDTWSYIGKYHLGMRLEEVKVVGTTEGYCMKCKVRWGMRDVAISGICTVCGGKMFKMVGSAAKTRSKVSTRK